MHTHAHVRGFICVAELGIDLGGIFSKTRAILLHRLNNKATEELDMGGALVFVMLLGGLHLLVRALAACECVYLCVCMVRVGVSVALCQRVSATNGGGGVQFCWLRAIAGWTNL